MAVVLSIMGGALVMAVRIGKCMNGVERCEGWAWWLDGFELNFLCLRGSRAYLPLY